MEPEWHREDLELNAFIVTTDLKRFQERPVEIVLFLVFFLLDFFAPSAYPLRPLRPAVRSRFQPSSRRPAAGSLRGAAGFSGPHTLL